MATFLRLAALFFFLGMLGMLAWPIGIGLRTGVMRPGGYAVHRKSKPTFFWMSVAYQCAACALFVWLIVGLISSAIQN
jgi:hypothetical protein